MALSPKTCTSQIQKYEKEKEKRRKRNTPEILYYTHKTSSIGPKRSKKETKETKVNKRNNNENNIIEI